LGRLVGWVGYDQQKTPNIQTSNIKLSSPIHNFYVTLIYNNYTHGIEQDMVCIYYRRFDDGSGQDDFFI
jgi:hypothetical protein